MSAHKTAIFCFPPDIPFFGKFAPKNQNCQFKLKFGTLSNSIIKNSMVMFTFVHFWPEIPLLGKFSRNYQNCQFKLKFGTRTNLNIQNWMEFFILSINCQLSWNYIQIQNTLSLANLVSRNLVLRLIRICWIQWRFSVFDQKKPF